MTNNSQTCTYRLTSCDHRDRDINTAQLSFPKNGLTDLLNSVTKIFVIAVKCFKPMTSSVRDQDATKVPATNV